MSAKETLRELFQLYEASKVICDDAKKKVIRGNNGILFDRLRDGSLSVL